jgi:putative ABC transport system permease protein
LSPSGTNFQEDSQFINYNKKVEERLRSIPGVEAVGAINTLPLEKGPTFRFRIEGQPQLPIDRWPIANYRSVTPDYFRALSIPVLEGRAFEERDDASRPLVALINKAVADDNFAGENPVGKRIGFGATNRDGQPVWFEIVGVVGNVRSLELREAPQAEVYLSSRQDSFPEMSFVLRTRIEPEALAAPVREAVQDVDRAQPVTDIRTMENIVSASVTQPRFNLTLLGIFGLIALVLSAAGIYGVTSYTVNQRTHEVGIRMAVGAQERDVLRLMLIQGMKPALIGLVIGLSAALGLTRLMKSLLFGVSATDPLTFAALAILLLSVALMACYFPARRAMKVDPMIALRYE